MIPIRLSLRNFMSYRDNVPPLSFEGIHTAVIAGDNGHLSNVAAGHCVLEHASQKLTNIVLSHLSSTNNTPQLALTTFRSIINGRRNFSPEVHVSTQGNPTKLFVI